MVKAAVEKHAMIYLTSIHKQKYKGKEVIYSNLSIQPFFRPRENIRLKTQRKIFALRSKINHIKASFCYSTQIEKCKKFDIEMDNYMHKKKIP